MIAQLTLVQCNQALPQANLMPSSNLALDRLGGPSAPMDAIPCCSRAFRRGSC